MDGVYAGYARLDITPRENYMLAGFDMRTHAAEGALDPLYVSALALRDDSGARFLLLSFDLLGVSRDFTERVCERLHGALGIECEQTLVCATHTHSAPGCIFRSRRDFNADYERELIDKAERAARAAFDDLTRLGAQYKCARAAGVASVRDDPRARSFDMPMFLVRFSAGGKRRVLIQFACHPTVMDARQYLYSRDLPGALERALNTGDDYIFINGACADISTRYTRRGEGAPELERLGRVWAQSARAALDDDIGWTRAQDVRFRFAQYDARVAGAKGLNEDARRALIVKLPQMIAREPVAGVKHELESRLAVLRRVSYGAKPDVRARVGIYDLGAFALLTLPVEARHSQGEALTSRAARVLSKPVVFAGYANGYESYVPSGKPLNDESSYEDLAACFAPDAMDALAAGVDECLRRLL